MPEEDVEDYDTSRRGGPCSVSYQLASIHIIILLKIYPSCKSIIRESIQLKHDWDAASKCDGNRMSYHACCMLMK